ncbi:S41 family peptidase [Mucilaginibacter sp. L3T2-6]|uniref:S41 family peptidase n=1 Tax=Mucilaginibacter sp. L3T2-6 TaxID=3062491 RepID=UPI002675E4A8|nr:S41 family peptidase [Mucilaginibacter sp. L3T2-6]MDO3640617.1 S41 family peptidase [Mucilaginibacter sp. L3T2-6]MDV6213044.1 S41 family peptidase [Mucilaginibacter sp. L3T2-6]
MKKLYLLLLSSLLLNSVTRAQSQDVYFTSNPALTPDGKTVIFAYEGDLWKADLNNPVATRITAMQGEESLPRVSPDGKWLAFTSNQFGNNDVYLMPMAGGDIKQLTFNNANDAVDSWGWDSKTIYFNSNMYNSISEYKTTINGGTPVRLFGNYFNTVHGVAEHPQSGELFFSDSWESFIFPERKHYKGAFNPDIQSYNPKTKAYKQYTDWIGKDFWTTIDQKGNIYFVSDEGNGEYNLYTFINGKKTALTQFDSSIKRPVVSANGEKVVFEKGYQLYAYDVVSKQTQKIPVTLSRNDVLNKMQEFNVKGKIESMDVSADGKKLAFVSRGELFISDIEGKFVKKIERGNAERVTEVKWLPDNKSLLFAQTLGGYPNWYTIAADKPAEEKLITNDKQSDRAITVNKEHTKGAYLSGRNEVRFIDLKTFESKTIANDEIWGFQNAQPWISSNGEYVVYTAYRNFEQDIFVYGIKSGKTINLTNSGVTETDPFWSPDGKYIYFASARTAPMYPSGSGDMHVYRMPLQKFDGDFRMDKLHDLFKEEKKEETKDKKDKDQKAGKKKPLSEQPAPKPPADIIINTDDIMRRLEQVSPYFGVQRNPYVIQKGDKTLVYYSSNHSEGKWAVYRTTIQPFEENKTEKVAGEESGGFDIVQSGDKYYALINGNICTLNIDANKLEKIDIGYKFDRNLDGEFRQMYDETWAGLEENYYDGTFHGTDWKKMHDRYATYLPYVNNRNDLRVLLNDLQGELNSSHQGFYSNGNEEHKYLNYSTMETGILFDNDDPYKVASVVKNSNADKSGIDVQPGDRLKTVNGKPVDEKQDRNFYFTKPSLDKEMELTFDRSGKEINVKLHPESRFGLNEELYNSWIDHNRAVVTEKSKNRIAYSYMKDMGGGSLETFLEDMVDDAYKKDALILDLRYNTGGNVHDAVLRFLSQRPYLQWQYRDGKKSPQPNFAPAAKPIILLVNEQTLSDGEMTAQGFKELKLGKIIGTETYRWIIFTSGKGLVDGSFYRIPAWGCFTLDGKDIEKNGVSPDIYVKNTFTDRLENKDPQLDRAIDEIMKELK